MKKNNKGFTLVELLVAISILGIILIIALPQINNIQNSNKTTKYKKYAEIMITSAKLYTDSYSEDMFGNNQSGCYIIKYDAMKEKNLLKDIEIDGSTCKSEKTFVKVRKTNDNYLYESSIYCTDKQGKVVYDKQLPTDSCDSKPDEVGPNITISAAPEAWTKGTDTKVTVKVWDEYGMLENTKIKIKWTQDGTLYEERVHNFKNKRYSGKSETNALEYTFKVPQGKTGKFRLTVTPENVRDANGNYQVNSTESGEYKLDNTPPNKPTTVKMYKWNNNENKPSLDVNFATLTEYNTPGQCSDKFILTKPEGSTDEHSSPITYQFITRGVTANNDNEPVLDRRNIEAQGLSCIKWRACDALCNCSEYTAWNLININKAGNCESSPPNPQNYCNSLSFTTHYYDSPYNRTEGLLYCD